MRKVIIFICASVMLFSSCQHPASSRYEVVQLKNDRLTDLEKISLFEQSTDIMSASAYAAIANLYANAGNYPAALETLQEAIVQEPMNSFYHTRKSNYAYEIGDLSTAYREALTAYQLGSKSLQESLVLAKMGVALSEYSIVNDIIDSLVLVYPNDPEVVYMAARKFEKASNMGQAIDYYQKGIVLSPERLDNYFHLASLYLSMGNYNSTIKTLERFKIPDIEPRFSFLKAEAYARANVLDSAERYYDFLVTDKKDSLVYTRLIDLYRKNDLRQQLSVVSTTSADSFPESKYFLRNAGEVLDARYKYEEALVYFEQLYELDTLDTMVAQEVSVLQRKIAYLQRKRRVERFENAIPAQGISLPALDSLRKD